MRDALPRLISSVVEHSPCKRAVVSSSLTLGLYLKAIKNPRGGQSPRVFVLNHTRSIRLEHEYL